MKNILLDTSTYGRFFRGDERVLDPLSHAETVYFSAIVMGELLAGFRGGVKLRENRSRLPGFLQSQRSKPCTSATKQQKYSQVKHALQLSGTPIPMNDVWIASQVIETGSVLVTFDQHFQKVAGLRIWDIDD